MHPRKFPVVRLLECCVRRADATLKKTNHRRLYANKNLRRVHAPPSHLRTEKRSKRVCTRASAPSWTCLSDEGGPCEGTPFIAQEGPENV